MKTRRKTLPPVPAKAPAELRPLMAAMAEILETGEGVRGNPLDRKLTLRDMLDGGIARLRVPGNADAGLVPGEAPPNLAVPPAPAGFAADGSFFGMINLSWEPPYDQYQNHAHTNIYRSESDNFATASLIGREAGMFYSDLVRNDATSVSDPISLPGYYYWVTFSSTANIEGPPNSPDGAFARPLPDASYLLAHLSGKLGSSELGEALNSRIDKIDGPASLQGSVAQRLSAESTARQQAINAQSAALSANIAAERSERIAAISAANAGSQDYTDAKITAVQVIQSDGFQALAQQIDQIEAGLGGDYTVGMSIERQARIDGDASLASSLSTLTSYAQGVAADVVSEQQARAEADGALASDISALYVEREGLQSSISNEAQARISADTALSSVQQVIAAASAVGSAAYKVSSEVFVNESEAMATRLEELRVSTGASDASIRYEMEVLSTGDAALSQRIDSLTSTVGDTTALVRSEEVARVAADAALSGRIDSAAASVGQATAQLQVEATARAAADSALSQQITTLQAEVGDNFAAVQQTAVVGGEGGNRFTTGWWRHLKRAPAATFIENGVAYALNGALTEQAGFTAVGPNGVAQVCWRAVADGDGQADGGWNATFSAIDHERDYILAAWVNASNAASGTLFLGCGRGGSTLDLSGAASSNPYFWSGSPPQRNKWYLAVGILHGSTYTGGDSGLSGLYDPSTGSRVQAGSDFKIAPGATTQVHRAYQYYAQTGGAVLFAEPRFQLLTPSITPQNLMAGQVVQGLSAQYTVKMDVNGYASGFGAYNDGQTADFAVLADRFWIARPGVPDSAVKPFMIVGGKTYIDSAFIREASIQEGQLGPISFGKIFDNAGRPVTTVGGKLRADVIDVNSLQVVDANIAGVIKSNIKGSNGQPRWILDKAGGFTMNGAGSSGRLEMRDDVLKVFDSGGRIRVQIGNLNA